MVGWPTAHIGRHGLLLCPGWDPATPSTKYLFARTFSYKAVDDLTVEWAGLPGFVDADYQSNFWTPLPKHVLEGMTADGSAGIRSGGQDAHRVGPLPDRPLDSRRTNRAHSERLLLGGSRQACLRTSGLSFPGRSGRQRYRPGQDRRMRCPGRDPPGARRRAAAGCLPRPVRRSGVRRKFLAHLSCGWI